VKQRGGKDEEEEVKIEEVRGKDLHERGFVFGSEVLVALETAIRQSRLGSGEDRRRFSSRWQELLRLWPREQTSSSLSP
jgi:hypothetical protein